MLILEGKKFLTVRETAEALQLSEATIRRWIKRGKVKAVKLGKAYMINVEGFSVIDGKITVTQAWPWGN